MYVPASSTVRFDNVPVVTAGTLATPFLNQAKVPPVGLTLATILVVWVGNNRGGLEAVKFIVGNGFTYRVAGLEIIDVHNPITLTRYVLVFIFCVTAVKVNDEPV